MSFLYIVLIFVMMPCVGIRSGRRTPGQRVDDVLASGITGTVRDPGSLPYGSPFGSARLTELAWADIFGSDISVNSRQQAMRIPAIKRARNLLVGTIVQCPLRAWKDGVLLPTQPTWLYATNTAVSPQHRMAYTVDDHVFSGASLWRRTNLAPSSGSFPATAYRVPVEDWEITADLQLEIQGQPVRDDEVILLPAFDEGLLEHGKDVLSDTRELYGIVRQRLLNPAATIELQQTGGAELTNEEIDDLVDRYAERRRRTNGAVGFINQHLTSKEMGAQGDAQLLIDARNAAAVDLARSIGVSAGMVDATAPKASLNYETQTGRSAEFIDLDVRYYMAAIEARLSMDDCVPAGTVIGFDLTQVRAIPAPTTPTAQD